ncbi:hypothetical protein SZ66_21740 [Pantoea ananatis]|nr:hypothetical protein [Pantoea ananatis]
MNFLGAVIMKPLLVIRLTKACLNPAVLSLNTHTSKQKKKDPLSGFYGRPAPARKEEMGRLMKDVAV